MILLILVVILLIVIAFLKRRMKKSEHDAKEAMSRFTNLSYEIEQ